MRVGDAVIVHLPKPGTIPADSTLGRKRETILGQRLTVSGIIPAAGLGGFTLRPNQQQPRNAYVSLSTLQTRLRQPDRVNALLVAGNSAEGLPTPEDHETLQRLLRPTLADYGLSLQRTARGDLNLTSDRMILGRRRSGRSSTASAARRISFSRCWFTWPTRSPWAGAIPYSTVAALDFTTAPPLGPFLDRRRKPLPPLGDHQIVLNSWAAEHLGAQPGDAVRITYFDPKRGADDFRETSVTLRLVGIVELSGAADDRALVPPLPGVTDRPTMLAWDPPFPFDRRRIGPDDKAYWKQYGPTPKAFVSLTTGRQLWASRFGQTTSVRSTEKTRGKAEGGRGKEEPRGLSLFSFDENGTVPLAGATRLPLDPAAMGFVFQPVKRQGLAASAGATPFSILFLAFSSFLIFAAVMLVALLFRLAIERRAAEIGILLAVGFSRRAVGRLLAAEGLLVAAAGMRTGRGRRRRLCRGAVGRLADVVAGRHCHAVSASVRDAAKPGHRLRRRTVDCRADDPGVDAPRGRIAPRQLLAGQTSEDWFRPPAWLRVRWRRRAIEGILAAVVVGPAVVLAIAPLGEDVQAGAFFGAGAAALAPCWHWSPCGCGLGPRCAPWPSAAATSSHGPQQCRAEPRPQHAHHGPGGRGLFPDRGRRRLPDRSVAGAAGTGERRRRFRPGRPERSAHLCRPQHAGGPPPTGLLAGG